MDSDVVLPSPTPTDAKPRGRPQAGPESYKQRVERLQAELRDAQTAMKQAEEKRAGIIGHACLRYIRHNSEFARQLATMLRGEIRSKADRAAIADVLQEPDHRIA